ncbi:MAG: flagellar biosynthesis protein FlhB [Alphaproteobacteria bacterium]|nr:flagellar biosynthesis protein FlhB [Alphaproteobacteria bacterium]
MAEETPADDRTEEATPKKLEDARKKGDIIFSPEVGAALSLFAATFVLAYLSGPIASSLGRVLTAFIAAPETLHTDPDSLRDMGLSLLLKVMGVLALAGLGFTLAAIASRYLQDRPTFTAARLQPKLDKIDPFKGFGRVFGRAAFANFWKGVAKLTIVGAAMAWSLWPHDGAMGQLSTLDASSLLLFARERSLALLMSLACAAAVIALIDYIFARQSFMRRMRMTRRELREEFKQSEGDPMIRMRIRQLRTERARRRMMAQVPKASVVITNPTHYAVALRYDDETPAPLCLAKGVDDVALRIRAEAEAHDVPIVEDPPLARALFAAADLDAPIPREHYEAVAKVIGFVMRLAARRRGGRRPNQRN